ncbi:MAG: hypothetical protein IJK06_04300 [Clostridia bacterium]|nr:hypothetical protein [Clostridia bacterium]
MPRGNRTLADPLQRTRSRNAAEERNAPADSQKRKRQIRSWIILVVIALGVALGIHFLGGYTRGRAIQLTGLSCSPSQGILPFRDGLVYYDGTNLYHMSASGALRWTFQAGREMKYTAGPAHVALWNGAKMMLVDKNGNATYSDTLEGDIQFVRVGEKYIAVVLGDDTSPKLNVKNMEGGQEDSFANTYDGLMLLDAGFFGDQGQYLWTLALDVYGTASNTILNTFQVGKMNYGQVSLGEDISYKVLYENSKLRVFTTQQVYTYDYRCVQDTNATMLVYGWKLIDEEIPPRGRARFLLAPTGQISGTQAITELRLMEGEDEKRYTLPATCVGACVYNGNVYAVAGSYVYRVDKNNQKSWYQIPSLEDEEITAYYGVTDEGVMLLSTSAERMYALTLPE